MDFMEEYVRPGNSSVGGSCSSLGEGSPDTPSSKGGRADDVMDHLFNFWGQRITDLFTDDVPPAPRRSASAPRSSRDVPDCRGSSAVGRNATAGGASGGAALSYQHCQAPPPRPPGTGSPTGGQTNGLFGVVVSGISSFGQRASVLLNTLDDKFDSIFHMEDDAEEAGGGGGGGGGADAEPWLPQTRRPTNDGPRLRGLHVSSPSGSSAVGSPAPPRLDQPQTVPAKSSADAGKAKPSSRAKLVVRRAAAPPALVNPTGAAFTAAAPGSAGGSTNGSAGCEAAEAGRFPGSAGLARVGEAGLSAAAAAAAPAVPSLASLDAPQLRQEVLRLRRQLKLLTAEVQEGGQRYADLQAENSRLLRGAGASDPSVCEVVSRQLQCLLADKARLLQRNASLAAEATGLRELLAFATQGRDSDQECDSDSDGDGEALLALGGSAAEAALPAEQASAASASPPAMVAAAASTPVRRTGWEFAGRQRTAPPSACSDGTTAHSTSPVCVPSNDCMTTSTAPSSNQCDGVTTTAASISALHYYYSRLLNSGDDDGSRRGGGRDAEEVVQAAGQRQQDGGLEAAEATTAAAVVPVLVPAAVTAPSPAALRSSADKAHETAAEALGCAGAGSRSNVDSGPGQRSVLPARAAGDAVTAPADGQRGDAQQPPASPLGDACVYGTGHETSKVVAAGQTAVTLGGSPSRGSQRVLPAPGGAGGSGGASGHPSDATTSGSEAWVLVRSP